MQNKLLIEEILKIYMIIYKLKNKEFNILII